MIVIEKPHTQEEQIRSLAQHIEDRGLRTHIVFGDYQTIIGIIGDTRRVDEQQLSSLDIVQAVKHVSEPYKSANRKFHPDDSVIEVGSEKIGHGHFALIAGPCSVENEEQIISVARSVKAAGATMLRGGAFKPRTAPYDFQGLKAEGIELLLEAKKETGLPIVSEIMNINHLDLFAEVDVIQVGARNMQNFELLKELGHCDKPILLKRGLSSTLEELLMSAEYIMSGGNENIILCERGIRTFETYTRNTLDLSAVPLIKKYSHLPVVVDPSHATGHAWLVPTMAKAAIAAGADGLLIEVHNDPCKAKCDGAQSLNCDEFATLMTDLKRRLDFEGKKL